VYSTDFTGGSLPVGWSSFSGQPGSDPGAQWGDAHAVVGGGILSLDAWKDPSYGGEWVTGGVCQCGVPITYGAVFVRSRMTGPGPTQVEMLWPTAGWPPEIDFSETYGGVTSTMATLHYTAKNLEIHNTVSIDMTQWHTFGVVWTPTRLTYVVDGREWGSVANPADIPAQAMTLHIQQQTWCSSQFACPTSPQSTQVDWVAEYVATGHQSVQYAGFARGSSSLSRPLRRQVDALATSMASASMSQVSVVGYGDVGSTVSTGARLGAARAVKVATELNRRLRMLHSSATLATAGRAAGKATAGRVRISFQ
jgi:outer membrane protein OmpA-like peptidoglycan-associated protein